MSTRKLQQECDKLHKKIAEGLQIFDDIHDKIAATDNASQKERLEGDLRKEIKKLQRSRDQVKQWLGDSSIKLDKNLLQDSRSRIENAMERFKEVERVSKMKQFSNEGLELQTKLGASDVDEAKKNEASKYVTEVLEELARQNELLSSELSTYSGKKKLGNAQLAIDDLNEKIERNNMHIGKLEQVLHNLTNEQLKPEKIDEIKDDLDYYVENNQDPEFIEYDDFYDQLELDEVPEAFPVAVPPPASQEEQKEREAPKSPAKKEAASVPSTSSGAHATPSQNPPATAPSTTSTTAPVISNIPSLSHTNQTPSQPFTAPAKPPVGSGPSAAVLAQARAPPPGLKSTSKSGSPAPSAAPNSNAEELKKKIASSQANTPVTPAAGLTAAAVLSGSLQNNTASGYASAAASSSQKAPSEPPAPASLQEVKYMSEAAARVNAIAQNILANPLPFSAISLLLETSLLNCPDSSDAERPRQYNPQNVHPLSVDYPQEPMFELNSAKIMSKFDNDTLFFCFYYSEGQDNLAKYNAAKELSKRGWIFNSETKQWFSKDDRAKSRSVSIAPGEEETKRGESYKYFDYQNSWLTRRKDNFDFKLELQETF